MGFWLRFDGFCWYWELFLQKLQFLGPEHFFLVWLKIYLKLFNFYKIVRFLRVFWQFWLDLNIKKYINFCIFSPFFIQLPKILSAVEEWPVPNGIFQLFLGYQSYKRSEKHVISIILKVFILFWQQNIIWLNFIFKTELHVQKLEVCHFFEAHSWIWVWKWTHFQKMTF